MFKLISEHRGKNNTHEKVIAVSEDALKLLVHFENQFEQINGVCSDPDVTTYTIKHRIQSGGGCVELGTRGDGVTYYIEETIIKIF